MTQSSEYGKNFKSQLVLISVFIFLGVLLDSLVAKWAKKVNVMPLGSDFSLGYGQIARVTTVLFNTVLVNL